MNTYLFYIHALSGGGAERVWSVLASSLAERGHRVVFAVDYEASDNLDHLSPAVSLRVLGGSHATTVLRLTRLIKATHPDVLVSALGASNLKLTLAALGAGDLSRTILSFHGYAESEPQRLSRIAYLATPLMTRLTARTICVSDGLLHYMRRRWGAAVSKTVRLYNPVDVATNTPNPDAATLAARDPVVLAAGRLVAYKNFVALIGAFADVEPAAARLVILGEGPERDAIEREVVRLGLQGRVTLPGYVADPTAFYAEARCFVLPSTSESFGLVLVEALGHGLPVVATACDGPGEVLTTPDLGTIVPQGDMQALSAAISAALSNPGDPNPRARRAADFAVGETVDRYEGLFDAVASHADERPRHGIRVRLRPSVAVAACAVSALACALSYQHHATKSPSPSPPGQSSSSPSRDGALP